MVTDDVSAGGTVSRGTPLLMKKGTSFHFHSELRAQHNHPTLNHFTAVFTVSIDLCPVVEAVLNQQQVLDPDLAQKPASNKREAVRLQMEDKTLIVKNTVECL